MDDMSLIYNINLCRICQVPKNLKLVKTDSITEDGDTYLDLLTFIFNDILWIEDDLISLACKTCLEKVTDIAEFKRLCLETNGRRGALTFDPVKVEHVAIKAEENQAVTELPDDEPEAEAMPQQRANRKLSNSEDDQLVRELKRKNVKPKTKRKQKESASDVDMLVERRKVRSRRERTKKYVPNGKPRGRPRKPLLEGYDRLMYRCDICLELYNSLDKLKRHMFRHTGIKNYICTICGKKFVGKSDLNNHENLHVVELKYACDLCPKKFKASPHLRTHKIVVHTDRKDYKYLCTECGRKFALSSSLKEHLLRHNNTRNFPCELCDKSFHTKAGLRRHALAHSNVRPFKCNLCPAEYKRRDHLTGHKTKVHDIKNVKDQVQILDKIC